MHDHFKSVQFLHMPACIQNIYWNSFLQKYKVKGWIYPTNYWPNQIYKSTPILELKLVKFVELRIIRKI